MTFVINEALGEKSIAMGKHIKNVAIFSAKSLQRGSESLHL